MADFRKPREGSLAAGRLRDLITIQLVTPTKGAVGPPVDVPSTTFTVWAEYQGLTSDESAQPDIGRPPALDKRISRITARFLIRYRADIHAATHQIVYDGKTWNISEPIHDRRRTMSLIEANVAE